MKLSVSSSEVLRHITVAVFLIEILDAFTWSVEVKLAFRVEPLTLTREAINGPRIKMSGGVETDVYNVV